MLSAALAVWLPGAAWLIAMLAIGAAFRPLRGTTLRAAWWWSALAITAAAATEIAIRSAGADGHWIGPLRLTAGVGAFCPFIALLGAKRPQDRAWQWIVASFWMILALPAAQSWLIHPGEPLVVHPVWSWFLVVLIVVEASNYLPTRFGAAVSLLACGQALLLWQFLPWRIGREPIAWMPPAGLGLVAGAAVIAALSSRRRPAPSEPLNRLWRDFRDQFGFVWAMRIAERINASAKMYGWKTSLGWHGFAPAEGSDLPLTPGPSPAKGRGEKECVPPAVRADVEQALRTLLRRYVSQEWINSRMTKRASD